MEKKIYFDGVEWPDLRFDYLMTRNEEHIFRGELILYVPLNEHMIVDLFNTRKILIIHGKSKIGFENNFHTRLSFEPEMESSQFASLTTDQSMRFMFTNLFVNGINWESPSETTNTVEHFEPSEQ
jgi:hypothetical protein